MRHDPKGVGLTPRAPVRFVLGGSAGCTSKGRATLPRCSVACICDEHFNSDKSRRLEKPCREARKILGERRSATGGWLNRQRGGFRSAKTKACRRHPYANARSIASSSSPGSFHRHRVRRFSRSLERQPVVRERRLLHRCARPALGRRLANARKLFVAGATAASRIARAASLTLRQDAQHGLP
jgi:hypothetical protein